MQNQDEEEHQQIYDGQSHLESTPYLPFDTLLLKLGFHPYQTLVYLCVICLCTTEGSIISVLTMTMPILSREYNISDFWNGFQASLIFVMITMGSFCAGQLGDRVGRKLPMIVSSFVVTISNMGQAFTINIVGLVITRAILGFSIGIFAPLAITLLAEVTQKDRRGKYMTLMTMSIVFGLLFGIFLAYLILDDLSSGNWRLLVLCSCIPSVIGCILQVTFLLESPRYLLYFEHYDEAFEIIDTINEKNGRQFFDHLTDEDKLGLINWVKDVKSTVSAEQVASFSELFAGVRGIITPILWLNWFTSSFVYYGMIFLMPQILERNTRLQEEKYEKQQMSSKENIEPPEEPNNILLLLIANLSEILCIVLTAYMIEKKAFGRKNSMIIFYFTTALCTVAKFCIAATFNFCFQYGSEIYPTHLRSSGLGIANGVGRLGGIVMPWVVIILQQYDVYAPFLYFVFQSLLSTIASFFLPFDTTGIELDAKEADSARQSAAVAVKGEHGEEKKSIKLGESHRNSQMEKESIKNNEKSRENSIKNSQKQQDSGRNSQKQEETKKDQ